MAGPRNGATTANGAMVRTRDKATRPRASLGDMPKNTDLASARVTRASPAALSRWVTASLENGDATAKLSSGAARRGFCSGRHPVSVATTSWYGAAKAVAPAGPAQSAPAPVAAVAPPRVVAAAPPSPAVAPVSPAPVAPAPLGDAGERVSAWLADIEERQRLREQGPDLDAVIPDTPVW